MIHLSIFTVFAVVLVARFALAETLASLLHVPIRVSYCGREAEHTLGINQVYLTPEHPSFGSPLEVSFSGTPTKELACDGSVLELEVQVRSVCVLCVWAL